MVCLLSPGWIHAASLPSSGAVQLISNAATPAPSPQTLIVSQAGPVTITLTDQLQPAALASLRVAIATSTAVVTTLSVDETSGTSASQTVTLQPGTYTVQVLATAAIPPPDTPGGGTFQLQVTGPGLSAPLQYHDVVAAPEPPSAPGQSILSTQFTVTSAGSYQLTVTDLQFPAALQTLQVLVFPKCTVAPCGSQAFVPPTPSTLAGSSLSVSLSLSPGTYDLFVGSQADATALQGLYSIQIVNGSTTAYAATVPVGELTAAASFAVTSSSSVSVQLADLSTPAALSSLVAVVTQGPSVLQSYPAAGTQTFSASASSAFGPVQIYVAAQPGSGGQGAYEIYAQSVPTPPAAPTVLVDVTQPALAAGSVGFVYPVSAPAAAGNYQLGVYDFGVPQSFGALTAAAVQAGHVLASTPNGSGIFAVAAAPLTVLVFPTLASGTEGLFGVELVQPDANSNTPGSGTVAFATTQGVGAQFGAETVTITTAGSYELMLTDLGFPARLSSASVILTQGYANPGTQYSSGTTTVSLKPGNYTLNVLAQPGTGASYGLYGLQLSPAPTATLAATPTSVSSTQSVMLTWSSTNATACTASASPAVSGWSGSLPTTSGSQTLGPLSAATTFSISCSDVYGNSVGATASVAVTLPTANKTGGGAMTGPAVGTLGLIALWQVRRRGRSQRTSGTSAAIR
jgi:hypothetical protein